MAVDFAVVFCPFLIAKHDVIGLFISWNIQLKIVIDVFETIYKNK